MKKQLFISIGAVSVILLSLFSASCATTKAEKDDGVNYVQVKDESENLISEISYPEIKDFDVLNSAIEQYVANGWEQIKEDSKNSERPYEYIVQSEIYSSGSLISVLLNTYEYRGGANGETKLKSFNFDTKHKKFLDITEASGYTPEELLEITEMSEMSGENPFQNYVLDKEKLVIYFEPAVIAAHSEGIQTVSVPLKK